MLVLSSLFEVSFLCPIFHLKLLHRFGIAPDRRIDWYRETEMIQYTHIYIGSHILSISLFHLHSASWTITREKTVAISLNLTLTLIEEYVVTTRLGQMVAQRWENETNDLCFHKNFMLARSYGTVSGERSLVHKGKAFIKIQCTSLNGANVDSSSIRFYSAHTLIYRILAYHD